MPAKLVTVQEVDISPDLKHAKVWMGMIGRDGRSTRLNGRTALPRGKTFKGSSRVVLCSSSHLNFTFTSTMQANAVIAS
jgi:ribosome-binding factor A